MAKITYESLFGIITVDTSKPNPMIRSVGIGTEGKKCKSYREVAKVDLISLVCKRKCCRHSDKEI